ncbi:MAG: IMP dehydrogenase [Candidatus Woesearchaeota archaeon]|nr:MAG: IMP dehydrogenase [Candidatus Woesearchaeota archaeon]
MQEGLSYGDVLLVPKLGIVESRKDIDTTGRITKGIAVKVPFVSVNMDTVTEHDMAIAMARYGGLGIIHQFMTIEEQVEEVRLVKRATSHIIENPLCISPDLTLQELFTTYSRKYSFLVTDKDHKLVGILSNRDFLFETDFTKTIKELMTTKIISAPEDVTLVEAKQIFKKHKIEKLPLVDAQGHVKGLITTKDILNKVRYPLASVDKKGRFLVAAAVGVKNGFLERTGKLIKAGADIICVDIAHGHSELAIRTVKAIKEAYPKTQILAGNVATGEGAKALIEAGADGIKVGVGPGSACTTRIVAGTGVPQITALQNVSAVAKLYDVPIMADGGIKTGGDIAKAIVAGAESMGAGSLFSATAESPGRLIVKDGKRFKLYRGSASTAANIMRTKREGRSLDTTYTAEGIDTLKPFKGPVIEVFNELLGGFRSGLSYCGARTLKEAQENGEFIKITSAGMAESKAQFSSNGNGDL